MKKLANIECILDYFDIIHTKLHLLPSLFYNVTRILYYIGLADRGLLSSPQKILLLHDSSSSLSPCYLWKCADCCSCCQLSLPVSRRQSYTTTKYKLFLLFYRLQSFATMETFQLKQEHIHHGDWGLEGIAEDAVSKNMLTEKNITNDSKVDVEKNLIKGIEICQTK